jgi:hypothetical protein
MMAASAAGVAQCTTIPLDSQTHNHISSVLQLLALSYNCLPSQTDLFLVVHMHMYSIAGQGCLSRAYFGFSHVVLNLHSLTRSRGTNV